jgi:ATP-dependent DNA ligase
MFGSHVLPIAPPRFPLCYFVFDVIVLKGRDLTRVPFIERRKLLVLLSFTNPRIAISEFLESRPRQCSPR